MYTDWYSLGEVMYRKWHVYDMTWKAKHNFDSSKFSVYGSSFGGPLAIIKNDMKNINATSKDGDSKLWIHTSSGNLLAEVQLQNKRLSGGGWTDQEQLAVVFEDGMHTIIFLSNEYANIIIFIFINL